MKFPKFWARGSHPMTDSIGQSDPFTCWDWSDASVEEARQKADARAARIVERFLRGDSLDRYGYGDGPMREEVVQTLADGGGRELAVVSRNAYGALVLNAARAMFIDIDFPEAGLGATVGGLFNRLFGKPAVSPEQAACDSVVAWHQGHRDLGLRIYRTFAGLRCLVTNALFEPTHEDSVRMLYDLQSDKLYIRLCVAQECFRARLTAKPWRCGADMPPARFPWQDAQAEANYRRWQAGYTNKASRYAACRLIQQIGANDVHPEIQPILELHDRLACSNNNLPLG